MSRDEADKTQIALELFERVLRGLDTCIVEQIQATKHKLASDPVFETTDANFVSNELPVLTELFARIRAGQVRVDATAFALGLDEIATKVVAERYMNAIRAREAAEDYKSFDASSEEISARRKTVDPIVRVLEARAIETWGLMQNDAEFPGTFKDLETTLTDLNVMALHRAGSHLLRLGRAIEGEDAWRGFDFEWWIGSDAEGWLRYWIEAKRLYWASGTYEMLGHTIPESRGSDKRVSQLVRLREESAKYQAIPVYCFYNYVPDLKKCVCPRLRCANVELCGCTLAPLDLVERAMSRNNAGFQDIHGNPRVMPWGCFLKCLEVHGWSRKPRRTFPNPLARDCYDYCRWSHLPPALASVTTNLGGATDDYRLPPHIQGRWVVVTNISPATQEAVAPQQR